LKNVLRQQLASYRIRKEENQSRDSQLSCLEFSYSFIKKVCSIMINKTSSQKIIKGKVAVENGELYFESTGKGEPLILIHAGFSDRRDWKHQIEDFAEKFNTKLKGSSPDESPQFSKIFLFKTKRYEKKNIDVHDYS
jgi:hypothetical protein